MFKFKQIGIVIASLFLGLFITAGVPSLAQTSLAQTRANPSPAPMTRPAPLPTSAPGEQPNSPSAPLPNSNSTPLSDSNAARNQLSEVDRQYVMDANRNALAAIALGQLALKQATNPQVKQFAQAEIDEQVQVRDNLMRLQSSIGMNLPSTPTAKDQEVQTRMSRLTGATFDQAFMNEVGINAHLENAALYQREAALGRSPDLVEVATTGLGIITRHFNTASALTGYQVAQVPPRVDAPVSGSTFPSNGTTPGTAPGLPAPNSNVPR
jgi:putative membrane protein